MKKFGFTLAEVMVALALIGVITSLTIPTFVASNRNRTNAAKVSTMISSVENAFTSMIAVEAVQNLTETDFGRNQNQNNLSRYLKLLNSTDNMRDYYDSNNPFRMISTNGTWNNFQGDIIYETKNGALLIWTDDPFNIQNGPVESTLGYLTIDINGASTPNVWGRDAFYFRVGSDGLLYPAGSRNFAIIEGNANETFNNANSIYACTDARKSMGCTARLIQNNFETDY